ncbi:DEAD/DEAH box helicase [Candidatus Woesearchaeota archaeon]|nr:DEAD/DEAH box helicase [Candidatus Woesearchaeota archaeon]
MIKDFQPRLYQETILGTCAEKNTLVVLPTGMGKTNIFLMLAADRLKRFPNSKILLLGPTKPLIDQYYAVFLRHFDILPEAMAVFTGNVAPEKREQLWKKAQIIFSTPQGLENDIISRKISLEDVALLGFDEAHRAVGEYAYGFIAKQYMKVARYPRIVALTASPGSDLEKITEVCKGLFIEDIEVRTYDDPDVKPYIQDIDVQWVKVEFPEAFKGVQKNLKECLQAKISQLKHFGYIKYNVMNAGKKDILELQAALRKEFIKGNKDFNLLKSLSLLAEVVKAQHALELLETQGIQSVYRYMDRLFAESARSKVKAVKNLAKDINFKSAFILAKALYEENVEHPKLTELKKIVAEEAAQERKLIVFTQYRDSGSQIVAELNKIEGAKAKLFVGQMKKNETGMSQKEQRRILDEFRADDFNILVCTSIGEEGLDIPSVDLVIFFEPIPSAIRTIQRRGRTGRQEKGRVIILMTAHTRDEAYHWVARNKESRMHRTLQQLKSKIIMDKPESLTAYMKKSKEIVVFADYREKGSGILRDLMEQGIAIKLEKLNTADYVASSRVGIEIKNVEDFVNSIIDGRLLQQVKDIKYSFERPILIIEGDEDIYGIRNVHPNAIRGMLATIAVSFGVPIISTRNSKETASLIAIIAKREQSDFTNDFSQHADKPMSLKELQEYIISALPGIGPILSKPLLKEFKSVKNVMNASVEDLQNVEKIGPKKAEDIRNVVDGEYKEN